MDAVERAQLASADRERKRIAAWLVAKSDETEHYLKVAAHRGTPEMKPAQLLFAIKVRVLLDVLARMVEQNTLPLMDPKDWPELP